MFSQTAYMFQENIPGSNDSMQMLTTSKLANLFGLPAHHIAVLQGGLEAVHVSGIDSIRSTSMKSAQNIVSLSVSVFTEAMKTMKAAHRHFY